MIERNDGRQPTLHGAMHGEVRIAGGAATDTLIASAGHAMVALGSGRDSRIPGRGPDVIHVGGGQADGLAPVSGFRIDVENVRMVDFISTVAASTAPLQHDAGTLIDMVDIESMVRHTLA